MLAADPEDVAALEVKAAALRTEQRWEPLAQCLELLAELSFDAGQALAYTVERARVLADAIGDLGRAAVVWRVCLEWQPLDDPTFERLAAYYQSVDDHASLADLWALRAQGADDAAHEADDPRPLRRAWTRALVEEARLALGPLAGLGAGGGGSWTRPSPATTVTPSCWSSAVRAQVAAGREGDAKVTAAKLLPLLLPGPLHDEMTALVGDAG